MIWDAGSCVEPVGAVKRCSAGVRVGRRIKTNRGFLAILRESMMTNHEILGSLYFCVFWTWHNNTLCFRHGRFTRRLVHNLSVQWMMRLLFSHIFSSFRSLEVFVEIPLWTSVGISMDFLFSQPIGPHWNFLGTSWRLNLGGGQPKAGSSNKKTLRMMSKDLGTFMCICIIAVVYVYTRSRCCWDLELVHDPEFLVSCPVVASNIRCWDPKNTHRNDPTAHVIFWNLRWNIKWYCSLDYQSFLSFVVPQLLFCGQLGPSFSCGALTAPVRYQQPEESEIQYIQRLIILYNYYRTIGISDIMPS